MDLSWIVCDQIAYCDKPAGSRCRSLLMINSTALEIVAFEKKKTQQKCRYRAASTGGIITLRHSLKAATVSIATSIAGLFRQTRMTSPSSETRSVSLMSATFCIVQRERTQSARQDMKEEEGERKVDRQTDRQKISGGIVTRPSR